MIKDNTADKTTGKQFDLSHLALDDTLQGARLASFSRRTVAFAIDWLLLALAVRHFAVGLVLLLLYLFVRRRAAATIRQSSALINETVDQVEHRLIGWGIEQRIHRSFSQYTKGYIHALLIFFVLASLVVGGVAVAGLFFPEALQQQAEHSELTFVLQPFDGVYSELRIVASAVGSIAYFSLFTWKWGGQTPGKRIMGIRAVKLSNTPMTLWNSMERVSGYASSASLLLLGFFQYFWDRNHQTTHDKIAETIVIEVNSASQ